MASRKRTAKNTEAETVAQAENGAVLEDEMVEEQTEDQVQVTEAEVTAEGEAQAEETGHRCRLCNRPLTAEQSVVRGLGPMCASHVARALGEGKSLTAKQGEESYVDEEALEAAVNEARENAAADKVDPADFNAEENTHPSFPDEGPMKWVRLVDVTRSIREQGRSLALFIKAFGGDGGRLEPLAWYWKPVYVGRVRYLPAECELHYDDIPLKRERKAKEATEEVAPDSAETPAEAEETGEIADEVVA